MLNYHEVFTRCPFFGIMARNFSNSNLVSNHIEIRPPVIAINSLSASKHLIVLIPNKSILRSISSLGTTVDELSNFGIIVNNTEKATPVSYTHLRAHETRHDLVCRLL